jgi:hypothetical protein
MLAHTRPRSKRPAAVWSGGPVGLAILESREPLRLMVRHGGQ